MTSPRKLKIMAKLFQNQARDDKNNFAVCLGEHTSISRGWSPCYATGSMANAIIY